jgi:hypothetical protein
LAIPAGVVIRRRCSDFHGQDSSACREREGRVSKKGCPKTCVFMRPVRTYRCRFCQGKFSGGAYQRVAAVDEHRIAAGRSGNDTISHHLGCEFLERNRRRLAYAVSRAKRGP